MRIVYVEDEPDIRELTCLALESIGNHEVIAFASGLDLLGRLDELQPIDLLLLDVMMPEIDGKSLLRKLRTWPATANTPAIFMTAKTMPSEVDEMHRIGAVKVIRKPFDPMTLDEQVRAAVSA